MLLLSSSEMPTPMRCTRCVKKTVWLRPPWISCCSCITTRVGTAKDICTYRHLKPALVSLYVENLVQSGYLVRETDTRDRRKCRLKLTAQAIPVAQEGVACQDQFTKELLHGLSVEELAAWQRGLSVFRSNIERLNEREKKIHE